MAAPTTQLNIRLDSNVKKRADARLEQAGYTATQFFRLLWEALARPDSNETTVKNILAAANPPTKRAQTLSDNLSDNRAFEGANYLAQSLSMYGIAIASLPAEEDTAQIKEAYLTERYGACTL